MGMLDYPLRLWKLHDFPKYTYNHNLCKTPFFTNQKLMLYKEDIFPQQLHYKKVSCSGESNQLGGPQAWRYFFETLETDGKSHWYPRTAILRRTSRSACQTLLSGAT